MAPLLDKRDALPNQRTIHSLLLTYKLSVVEAGKHTVRLPLLNKYAHVPWDPSTVWGKRAWQCCWALEALSAHELSIRCLPAMARGVAPERCMPGMSAQGIRYL